MGVCRLNEPKEIKLEEIHCILCSGSGVHLNKVCPVCLGNAVLFRLKDAFDYTIGSEVVIHNYNRGN